MATVAARRRRVRDADRRCQEHGSGLHRGRVQRLKETPHVAPLDPVRSTQDPRGPVHIPVCTGTGDSLHPAQHRPLQLARRPGEENGGVAERADAGIRHRLEIGVTQSVRGRMPRHVLRTLPLPGSRPSAQPPEGNHVHAQL